MPNALSQPTASAFPRAAAVRMQGFLRSLIRRHAERRALQDLLERPDHQLADIGLTRDAVRGALAGQVRRPDDRKPVPPGTARPA